MVSIIITQARERDYKIETIEKSLKENPEQDLKKLIFECCNIFKCSKHKAQEYIDAAKWRIENATDI